MRKITCLKLHVFPRCFSYDQGGKGLFLPEKQSPGPPPAYADWAGIAFLAFGNADNIDYSQDEETIFRSCPGIMLGMNYVNRRFLPELRRHSMDRAAAQGNPRKLLGRAPWRTHLRLGQPRFAHWPVSNRTASFAG
jgi:hypothetical protein